MHVEAKEAPEELKVEANWVAFGGGKFLVWKVTTHPKALRSSRKGVCRSSGLHGNGGREALDAASMALRN